MYTMAEFAAIAVVLFSVEPINRPKCQRLYAETDLMMQIMDQTLLCVQSIVRQGSYVSFAGIENALR